MPLDPPPSCDPFGRLQSFPRRGVRPSRTTCMCVREQRRSGQQPVYLMDVIPSVGPWRTTREGCAPGKTVPPSGRPETCRKGAPPAGKAGVRSCI